MRWWWASLALCACRIGFDPLRTDDAGDGGTIATITFGERPTSMRTAVTRDATVDQSSPSLNYGAAEDLSIAEFAANGEHALVRFDLSSLAPSTQVTGARLSLVRVDYGDETPGAVELRLLRESWTEGTSDGGAGAGASWMTRDGSAPWMTLGGTTAQTLTDGTLAGDALVLAIDPAVVQGWIDDPASNDGILLTVGVNTAHMHFHSRNSMLLGRSARPELALDIVQ